MTKPVTLKEFKAWLEQFPEETLVEVAVQEAPVGWESWGSVEFEAPVLEKEFEWSTSGKGWEFTDFAGNRFMKETDTMFGKKLLTLGEKF